MTATRTSRVLSVCVPVSITETGTSNSETNAPNRKALSPNSQGQIPQKRVTTNRHMRRLVGRLVHDYGWTLGQDGNLYASNPSTTAWGERVN